ncbi:MAG: DUF86 domain-containing protein [Defluviitaleaceae bacterium]|nr:DUF86 domain-containing protein [Defluviitaleaceae bacterium]
MTDKDYAYLQRMLEFSRRIQRRVGGTTAETFLVDENLQDMVLYAIGQVGENANAVSDDIKDAHPDLLWNAIIGIRNRVFHSYGDIDMTLVYEAAVDHTPLLIRQLEKILG